MDELEVLKKEWQAREQVFPKVTADEIYPMLLKKSSSIVKWIFYISIGEILLWAALYFLVPESTKELHENMGLTTVFNVINILSYIVVFSFIYLFYKNHQKIQTTSSIKELMKNILRTRKTVRYFVYFNIGLAAALMFATNLYFYFNKPQLSSFLSSNQEYAAIPAETFIQASFVAGIIIIGFLVLFYWVIYGLLLRRLKKNYKRLKNLEK